MTSTNTLPETSFPVGTVEPVKKAKEQTIEALKDVAFGSVGRRIYLDRMDTDRFPDRQQGL